MSNTTKETIDRLLSKSKESFVLALEIYNKPTIKYRVEGFAILICNAWELMLKAHMINIFGEKSIYDKKKLGETLSLQKCIIKIFSNDKDPLRLNLEKIKELRDTSTHYITEEYEIIYVSLFQACIFNFNEKMLEFHAIDITREIPQHFLYLSVTSSQVDETEIRSKYPAELANRLIDTKNAIESFSTTNNNSFAISIRHENYITKQKNADATIIKVDPDASDSIEIIKESKDPSQTFNLLARECEERIRVELDKKGISLPDGKSFNKSHFVKFVKYFNLKNKAEYCYPFTKTTNTTFCYSINTVRFILDRIQEDPSIILKIKEKQKNEM